MNYSEKHPTIDNFTQNIPLKLTSHTLNSSIEFIKGVGPQRADLLKKELGIHTFGDALLHFPFRYEDRTTFYKIKDAKDNGVSIQLKGTIFSKELIKGQRSKRIVCILKDSSGFIELVWFKGIQAINAIVQVHQEYVVNGRITVYGGKKTMAHPELELLKEYEAKPGGQFAPVYSSTEKLNNRNLDNRFRRNIVTDILQRLRPSDIPENLPSELLQKYRLVSRYEAIIGIHLPSSQRMMEAARRRIKYEELFYFQLHLAQNKAWRKINFKGHIFGQIGSYFNTFYSTKLPFELTNAQKRVIKEIRRDLKAGKQMNRLLQGDVGSGKTMVALISSLMALDNDFQACVMAPTEILASQHHIAFTEYVEGLGIEVAFLSGSVKGKKRKILLERLAAGEIHILVGTHALIEDPVIFNNLGLAIIDEQHRFGVKQRSKLWSKSKEFPPHILVMTATPIPRTLAMTVYGDLDISVIDELPPGRKPVTTLHKSETYRGKIMEFMREEIKLGRQIYVVYPLIEESETLDLQNLQNGYDRLLEFFPRPDYQISIVHGRMKPKDKDMEMQRFVRGETNIMVATTVIEVGVNVPNASVMIIENAERFGLSQLHQLRGRVGRGAEKSYCILATSYKLSKEAKERIATMVRTNDGFEIAEADMKLRGPGNIDGTQQSGLMDLALVNLAADRDILNAARIDALDLIADDPKLEKPDHKLIMRYSERLGTRFKAWGKIS